MVDYSIFFEGQSNDFTTVNFSLIGRKPQNVIVKIYNNYLNFLEHSTEITLLPGVRHYIYYPNNSSDRVINFYDKKTLQLVSSFGLKGQQDLVYLDYLQFVKQTLPVLTEGQKTNLSIVFYEIFVKNLYSGDFIRVNEGDVVVDIGFNFGIFTYHSLKFNPSKIIGYEPNKNVSKHFKRMINDNRVTIHDCAVGGEQGSIEFYENQDTGMSTIIPELYNDGRVSSYKVPIVTFDDVIKTNNLEKINYLKVDCEGAEFSIFETMSSEYLSNNIENIVVEYHAFPSDEKVKKLLSKLKDCGFKIITQGPENDSLGMIFAKKLI